MKFERFTDDQGREWVKRVITPQDSMRWARVPSGFWCDALEPKPTESLAVVQRMLDGEGILLVLSGGTGCGKSTACAHALSKRAGLWVSAPILAQPDFADADEYGVRRETLDERMAAAGLLVLDDVGTEHSPSGYAAKRISAVLDHREAEKRPSIVACNMTPDEFKQAYGDRLASRLNGDALGWQQIAGPDLRRQRNPAHFQEAGDRE